MEDGFSPAVLALELAGLRRLPEDEDWLFIVGPMARFTSVHFDHRLLGYQNELRVIEL